MKPKINSKVYFNNILIATASDGYVFDIDLYYNLLFLHIIAIAHEEFLIKFFL